MKRERSEDPDLVFDLLKSANVGSTYNDACKRSLSAFQFENLESFGPDFFNVDAAMESKTKLSMEIDIYRTNMSRNRAILFITKGVLVLLFKN